MLSVFNRCFALVKENPTFKYKKSQPKVKQLFSTMTTDPYTRQFDTTINNSNSINLLNTTVSVEKPITNSVSTSGLNVGLLAPTNLLAKNQENQVATMNKVNNTESGNLEKKTSSLQRSILKKSAAQIKDDSSDQPSREQATLQKNQPKKNQKLSPRVDITAAVGGSVNLLSSSDLFIKSMGEQTLEANLKLVKNLKLTKKNLNAMPNLGRSNTKSSMMSSNSSVRSNVSRASMASEQKNSPNNQNSQRMANRNSANSNSSTGSNLKVYILPINISDGSDETAGAGQPIAEETPSSSQIPRKKRTSLRILDEQELLDWGQESGPVEDARFRNLINLVKPSYYLKENKDVNAIIESHDALRTISIDIDAREKMSHMKQAGSLLAIKAKQLIANGEYNFV